MLKKVADAEQQRRFHRLAFGLRASKKSQEEIMDAAQEFLEVSGIQQLEEHVLSFLFSHSGVLKMLATLDDTSRMLHQVILAGISRVRMQPCVCSRVVHPECQASTAASCHQALPRDPLTGHSGTAPLALMTWASSSPC